MPMSTSIGFLHLSDLHIGQSGQSVLLPAVRERLYEDLRLQHSESGPWHIVFFTGDLVNRGSSAEFAQLDTFLEDLFQYLNQLGSTPLLLAVPGNHDLQRPAEEDPTAIAMRLGWRAGGEKIAEQFWQAAARPRGTRPSKSPFVKLVDKAFVNYSNWYKKWISKHPVPALEPVWKWGILPGDFSVKIKVEDIKLGVVGLNSAFLQLSGDDYHGRLALDGRQLNAVCDADPPRWCQQHDATLLLTHHPESWLDDSSQRELRSELAPPGRFLAHLYGHMHEARTLSQQESGAPQRQQQQAASLFGLERTADGTLRSHGYIAGRLRLEPGRALLVLWPRREVPSASGLRRLVADTSYVLGEDERSCRLEIQRSPSPPRTIAAKRQTPSRRPAVETLLQAIAAERRSHLAKFVGRGALLQSLRERLSRLREAGGYLLLVGDEGSGKSALCAKLSETLAATEPRPTSPLADDWPRLRHLYPWLPGCLLCHCKQAATPTEVVQALLAQVQAVLGEPLPPEADLDESSLPYDALVLPSGQLADGAAAAQQLRQRQAYRLKHQQRWLRYALGLVVQRFGQVVLILDAVDELRGSGLEFLPAPLPAGVGVLLSCRRGELAAWCSDKLAAQPVPMEHLSRQDTALLTGVSDELGEPARQFNDRVQKESGGWPLLVDVVAADVRAQGGRFEQVRVDGQLDSVFERQALRFRSLPAGSAPPAASTMGAALAPTLDALREVLLLLAAFEPLLPLSLAELQGYLEQRGLSLPCGQSDVRSLLSPVADQLQGLDAGTVRLSLKAFAEYTWNRHLSRKDRRRVLAAIAAWLASDDDVRENAVASLLHNYGKSQGEDDALGLAGQVLDGLGQRRQRNRLQRIGEALFELDDESALAGEFLQRAAAQGSLPAMESLGQSLILGRGCPASPSQGERWLLQAAEAGSRDAKGALGLFLTLGIGLERDRVRGERYLREAAEQGTLPQLLPLMLALWVGALGPRGWSRALDLLRDAVQRQVKDARVVLLVMLNLLSYFSNRHKTEIVRLEEHLRVESASEFATYKETWKKLGHRLEELIQTVIANSSEILGRAMNGDNVDLSLINKEAFLVGIEKGAEILGNERPSKFELLLRAALAANADELCAALSDEIFSEDPHNPAPALAAIEKAVQERISPPANAAYEAYLSRDFATAAKIFYEIYKSGVRVHANDLAYMIRRNEVPAELRSQLPGIFELLDSASTQVSAYVTMNRALCYAAGVECESDWSAADRLVASLCGPEQSAAGLGLLSWWQGVLRGGDAEGQLVVGWLVRHGLVADPDGQSPAQRFALARAAGWAVPTSWDEDEKAP